MVDPYKPTLREAYGALNEATGQESRNELHERLFAVRYMGTPLGDHRVQFRNDDPNEISYTKEMAEALSFAHLAVAVGIDREVADIRNCIPPEPDLIVDLVGRAPAYVEVARVVASESARYQGSIDVVNKMLRRREQSDSAYLSEIEGRFVQFFMPIAPERKVIPTIVDEIVSVSRSIDFGRVPRMKFLPVTEEGAPALAWLGSRYIVGDRESYSTYVRATSDAFCFSPYESVGDFEERIADKMGKTYSVDKPVWLALVLDDLMQVPMLSLEAIRLRIPRDLGQFSRLMVGTIADALDIEAERI